MAEATRLAYGYCFRPLNLADIEQEQHFLKAYLASELTLPPVEDVSQTAQVYALATRYFGPSFNQWLELNRTGPRTGLSRSLRLWLCGEVSDQAVFNALNQDIQRLSSDDGVVLSDRAQVNVSLPRQYTGYDNGNEGMLALFTLLGPSGIAKLILSLDGKV